MPIRGEGEGLVAEDHPSSSTEQERVIYVLHPNCAIEEV